MREIVSEFSIFVELLLPMRNILRGEIFPFLVSRIFYISNVFLLIGTSAGSGISGTTENSRADGGYINGTRCLNITWEYVNVGLCERPVKEHFSLLFEMSKNRFKRRDGKKYLVTADVPMAE